MDYDLVEIPEGFRWGPLIVERAVADTFGVILLVRTTKGAIMQIKCSPKGHSLKVVRVK